MDFVVYGLFFIGILNVCETKFVIKVKLFVLYVVTPFVLYYFGWNDLKENAKYGGFHWCIVLGLYVNIMDRLRFVPLPPPPLLNNLIQSNKPNVIPCKKQD